MTNEKMRKRVVEVIEQWHRGQKRDMNGHTIWAKNDAENLALFLITEVIGDVESITEMWLEGLNLQFEKTEAAEYRAKVAERALKNAVDAYVGLECTCKGVYDSHFDRDEECKGCELRRFEMEDAIPCAVNKYLNYAEKELAEEEENGND